MEKLVPLDVDGKIVAMASVKADGATYLLVKGGFVKKAVLMAPSDFDRMFPRK